MAWGDCSITLMSWLASVSTPRGRWYLKERPSVYRPDAHKAALMLSPAKPL